MNKPIWWPENPYFQEAMVTITNDNEYIKAIPDPALRTAVSWYVSRQAWGLASDAIFKVMQDNLQDKKDFPDTNGCENKTFITKSISKASIAYYDECDNSQIIIADEFDKVMFKIKDELIDTQEQRIAITKAVEYGIKKIMNGESICYMCIGGRSRSPVLACLVASLTTNYSFDYYFSDLQTRDKTVRSDSELLPLLKRMYPNQWKEN